MPALHRERSSGAGVSRHRGLHGCGAVGLEHRAGIQHLARDLTRYTFTAVVTEHVDRLARDQLDAAQIFKHIRACGAVLYTTERPDALDTLYFGIRGVMSAYHIENLAEKTRRGHQGKATRGLFPAGLAYGYRVVSGMAAGLW